MQSPSSLCILALKQNWSLEPMFILFGFWVKTDFRKVFFSVENGLWVAFFCFHLCVLPSDLKAFGLNMVLPGRVFGVGGDSVDATLWASHGWYRHRGVDFSPGSFFQSSCSWILLGRCEAFESWKRPNGTRQLSLLLPAMQRALLASLDFKRLWWPGAGWLGRLGGWMGCVGWVGCGTSVCPCGTSQKKLMTCHCHHPTHLSWLPGLFRRVTFAIGGLSATFCSTPPWLCPL